MGLKRTLGANLFGVFFIALGIIFVFMVFWAGFLMKGYSIGLISSFQLSPDPRMDELRKYGEQHKSDLLMTGRWEEFNDKLNQIKMFVPSLKKVSDQGLDPLNLNPAGVMSIIVGLLYLISGVALLIQASWARVVIFASLATNAIFYFCMTFSFITISNLLHNHYTRMIEAMNLVHYHEVTGSMSVFLLYAVYLLPLHLIFCLYIWSVWRYFFKLRTNNMNH